MNLNRRFSHPEGRTYRLTSAVALTLVSTGLVAPPVNLVLVVVTFLGCAVAIHIGTFRAVNGFSRYSNTSNILNGLDLGWQLSIIAFSRILLLWSILHVGTALVLTGDWQIKAIAFGATLLLLFALLTGVIIGTAIGVSISLKNWFQK